MGNSVGTDGSVSVAKESRYHSDHPQVAQPRGTLLGRVSSWMGFGATRISDSISQSAAAPMSNLNPEDPGSVDEETILSSHCNTEQLNSILQEVRRHLECSVCFHAYNEGKRRPKGLTCQHTFCLECLLGIQNEKSITCPVCKQTHKLIESAEELPCNPVLVALHDSMPPPTDTQDAHREVSTDNKPKSAGLIQEATTIAQSGDKEKMKKFTKTRESQLQNVPLDIAVTGRSGVGKSSFINTLRQLRPDHPKAARTGSVETTVKMEPCRDRKNRNLVYWDLPGVGSPNFPQSDYLEKIQFDIYDFYLILSATRFSEDDLWLAKKVKESGKTCFFVRTKIDLDIMNEKRNQPGTFNEETLLKTIRDNCGKELATIKFAIPIFLISTNLDDVNKWDFSKLLEQLLQKFPSDKRPAMAMSRSIISPEDVEQKYQELKKRIVWLTVASGASGAIPVPGMSLVVSVPILVIEVKRYMATFELDDQSLQHLATTYSIKIETLQATIKKIMGATAAGAIMVEALGAVAFADPLLITTYAVKFVPLIGSIVGAITSASATSFALHWVLGKAKETALEILTIKKEKMRLRQGVLSPT